MQNKMRTVGTTIAGMTLVGLFAFCAAPASATEILTFSDGISTRTFSGDGSTPLSFTGLLDGSYVSIWGTGTPVIGTSQEPELGLLVSWAGQGTLNVSLEENGFTTSVPLDAVTQVGGVIGVDGSASIGSSSNGNALSSFSPIGPGYFSSAQYDYGSITGSYGLDLTGSVTNSQSGVSSGFYATVAVPEPATIALFAAGLVGCAAFVARGRRRMPVLA